MHEPVDSPDKGEPDRRPARDDYRSGASHASIIVVPGGKMMPSSANIASAANSTSTKSSRSSFRAHLINTPPSPFTLLTCVYVASRGAANPPEKPVSRTHSKSAILLPVAAPSDDTAGCPSGQRERSVKPSAQPTQVRTLHLPHQQKSPLTSMNMVRGLFSCVRLCPAVNGALRLIVPNAFP